MTDNLSLALQRLADESRPVRAANLAPLSDLTKTQTEAFRAAWDQFSAERRIELMTELVEQAGANVQLNFCAILRASLGDEDARVRRLAIEGLWEDDRVSLVRPLVTMLAEDPADDVRAAAAASLGRFVLLGELGEIGEDHAQQAITALSSAWSRPREVTDVRRRALEGLAYTDLPGIRDLIHSAYYDEDKAMRQSAVFAMGRSADQRWAKLILAELRSNDADMRFEAASAAGELALPGAVRPLIGLLDDPDANVRQAAAIALGQIGGPAAKRALEACVAGEDVALAEAAEQALEELVFNSGTVETPMLDFRGQPGSDDRNGLDEQFDDEDEDEMDLDDEYPGVFDDEEPYEDEEYLDDEDEEWDDEVDREDWD